MKKFLLALMCLCVAVTFTACSTEHSVKTETKFSVSTKNLQELLDDGDKNIRAGKYDDAIKNFNDAIEMNDQLIEPYNGRASAYFFKGDFDKAIADFNKAIELDPKYGEAYSNRGQCYAEKNENAKAMADFNKAIELNPNYDQVYVNRGAIYYNAGEKEKAIADFKKALELNPNNENAKHNLQVATAN